MTITTKTTKTKRQAAGRSSSKNSGAGDPRWGQPMTGAQLKDRRLRLGLSQAAFGALIGVSRYTVARAEHGSPSENVVMRVAVYGRGPS
jgi:DNA-binding XRE family transcriptional regulator